MKNSYLNGTAALLPVAQRESVGAVADEVMRDLTPVGQVLQSELQGVTDEAWTRFCIAMKVQPSTAVSDHGGLGMFDMRMPRLEDLGLVTNLRRIRLTTGYSSWDADWVAPLDERTFLTSASIQYKVFSTSMQLYYGQLRSGEIHAPRTKERLSMSAWLAILHKAGPTGLAQWGDASKRKPKTAELVKRMNGIF